MTLQLWASYTRFWAGVFHPSLLFDLFCLPWNKWVLLGLKDNNNNMIWVYLYPPTSTVIVLLSNRPQLLKILIRRDPEFSLSLWGLSLAGIDPKTGWWRGRLAPRPNWILLYTQPQYKNYAMKRLWYHCKLSISLQSFVFPFCVFYWLCASPDSTDDNLTRYDNPSKYVWYLLMSYSYIYIECYFMPFYSLHYSIIMGMECHLMKTKCVDNINK